MSFLWHLPGRVIEALSPAKKRPRASNSIIPSKPSPDSPSANKRRKVAWEDGSAPSSAASAANGLVAGKANINEEHDVIETIEHDVHDSDDELSDLSEVDSEEDEDDDDDDSPVRSGSEPADLEGTTLVEDKTPDPLERPPEVRNSGGYSKKERQALQEIKAQREAAVDALEGWSPADKQLKHKLNMRGFEPLLPKHMEIDFFSFPTALFTKDESEAYINTSRRRGRMTDKAQSARLLRDLVDLGQDVRMKVFVRRSPEWMMKKRFETYIKWSLKDAGLWQKKGVLPLIEITYGSKLVSALELQRRLLDKLADLAHHWRHALDSKTLQKERIPPLYGIIISYTLMAIVSYVPEGTGQHPEDSPANYLRQMGVYRFHDADHDVWNAFAAAILTIHCRNTLLTILDSGSVVDYDGTDIPVDEDPDASP